MPTATEERIILALTLPTHLGAILEDEVKFLGSNRAALVRQIIKWHRGKATGRHPDSPPVVLKKRKVKPKQVKKPVLIDMEDGEHLDALGYRIGLTRASVAQLVILEYFGLPLIPRTPPKR